MLHAFSHINGCPTFLPRSCSNPWLERDEGLGYQYHIANNEEFSSPTNNLYLRVREVRIGGRVGVRLNQSLALLGEAGVVADRKLTFADRSTALSSLDVPAKPYVSISLRYSFSKKRHWEDFGKW